MTDLERSGADTEVRPRRIAPYIVLVVTLLIGGLFVVLAGSDRKVRTETADTPLLGKAAPDIVDPTLDGGTFALSALRGQWVVLNFFQSSCVPCKEEHPELIEFAEQQAALADGAKLISVVWSDTSENVAAFFTANGGAWPVVLDDDGSSGFDYGVAAVPETWIIDPNGRVAVHYIAKVTADELGARIQALRDGVA